MPTPATRRRGPGADWRRMAALGGALVVIMVTLVTAFALPGIHSAPKDVPITIVASQPARTQLEAALDRAGADVWSYHVAPDAAAAREQILDRTVYGAFVVTDDGTTLYYASAAGGAVASLLTQTASHLGAATHTQVTTENIRPYTSEDPRGAGLAAGALPIALGGWIAAVAIIAMIGGNRQRLVMAAGFAVVGGFALVGVLFGVGTLQDDYFGTSLAAMLGIAATSFLVLGLQRSLKGVGIGIAALVLIVLGNPLSGLTSAPELLPHPWGALGQLLPPGATGTLLRNVSFFDGNAIARPITILAAWLVIGLILYVLGVARARRGATTKVAPADDPEPVDVH